jgi:antitoxin VapB
LIDITLEAAGDRDGENLHAWAQSGRTPAERVSFAGKEVRVSKVADKVIFEPLEEEPFDIEHWRAELVAAGARAFLPEGLPEDEPAARDDEVSFD